MATFKYSFCLTCVNGMFTMRTVSLFHFITVVAGVVGVGAQHECDRLDLRGGPRRLQGPTH
jgi:hypothetical protein